jgi:hypothetical protein
MTNRLHMEPKHRDGPGVLTWVLVIAFAAAVVLVTRGCG